MKKIFSIIFIGVLFFQVVYVILPTPHAKAATAATDSIENQALSYQAFVYLTDDGAFTCGSVFAGSGSIPKDDGPKLLWFKARTEETRSGSILDPSGQADCNQGVGGWLEKALQIWGYSSDYTAFLTDVGFTNDGLQYNKPDNLLENAKKVIRQKYYGTTSTSAPQLTDALKYRIYYENFANGCQIKEAFGPTLPSGYVKSDVINEIKVVDSAGNVKSTFVQTEKGKGDGIVIGYNVGAPQQGFEADCGWLADQLKNDPLVNAYAAYVKSHPADTTAPTSDVSGKAVSPSSGSGNILSGSDDHCLDWSPLSWLMCPIISMADGLYSMFISFMQDILNININDFENNEGLKASWAVMRNVASSALVLVALIMIAGQIFNFEFLSAYTVKKVLPRLVIAAIAIQLSWFIFTTAIVIIDAIGVGIYSLMLLPFQHALGSNATEISTIYSIQSNGSQVFSGALAAMAGVAAFSGAGGLGGIVAVAIAGAFAIGVALVTLILRKVLIIGLLILAPLALVAWVLPGTQKYWTSWWNLFIKLLLMFPLIMVLIASGKIAASIIGQQDNAISPLIALIVYFLPLFLIPATFKFAGGIFATTSARLSGMSSKWGKSTGGAAANYTKESVGRYARNNSNRFSRGLNYAAHGAITTRQRSRAAESSRKAIHEREANFQALVEAQTAGMGRADKHVRLREIINTGSDDMAEGAARILAAERGWGELDNLDDRGLHRIRHLAASDPTGFGSALWTSRRDIADGPADRIATMSANDAAGQHTSFFNNQGNVDQLDQRTAVDLTRNQTLMSALNPEAQQRIYDRAQIPNPTVAAPNVNPPVQPAGRNPAVQPVVNQTAPYSEQDLASMDHNQLQIFVNNAGGMDRLHDDDLNRLHTTTSGRSDNESVRLHQELQNEIDRRNP